MEEPDSDTVQTIVRFYLVVPYPRGVTAAALVLETSGVISVRVQFSPRVPYPLSEK